jgi:two-component system, NarL family, sensor histidine kinase DegS
MDAVRAGPETRDSRFDGLRAEASAAVGYSANTLRGLRERYREAYGETLRRWQTLRDELEEAERLAATPRSRVVDAGSAPADAADAAAAAAETEADGDRLRALRAEVEFLTGQLGTRQSDLAKLEMAERTLERTWLFLEHGDATLVGRDGAPATASDMAMRIVEAQEAERTRLAQEVHDGPAQALSSAIFQVEYIERVLGSDPRLAATEIRYLRELLRRELGDVRSFITQLRPPLLDEMGLDGAIEDAAAHVRALTGLEIQVSLAAPGFRLGQGEQTVVLRIAQEALQNVRKHAAAQSAAVSTRMEDDDWIVEIRDDGRGFDVGAVAARGRRNFGLQFMRERAELIGGRFDVRSRPDGGTVVRLAIPIRASAGAEESR